MKRLILFLLFLCVVLFSCRREEIIADQGVHLRFSSDTVFMDTVFTTVGSSTYNIKVYNPSDEKVVIDNIRLDNDIKCIRLNINGTASNNLNDVEILPKDSIYIFMEITDRSECDKKVVPEDSSSFIHTDKIIFQNKDIVQSVELKTVVRDAYFHFPTNFVRLGNTVIPYSVAKCDDIWVSDKPHVVYGYLLVDSDCELTIKPGSEVYFHNNSGLWVYDGGTLTVGDINPTTDSVLFTGDRLEPFYEDVPGQWGGALGGIFLMGGSVNNSIGNTVIKNATTGLRLDSTETKNLDITNSFILNSSRTGIYGGFGNVDATNLVVANAGLHLFYGFGGDYDFRHCTFANYWNQSTRSTAGVVLTNYFDTQDAKENDIRLVREVRNAYFGNCLIVGNNRQELGILHDESDGLDYYFNHAIIDVDPEPEDRGFNVNDPALFNEIQINAEPGFVNTAQNRYALDTVSQAVNQGNSTDGGLIPSNTDIRGMTRNYGGLPDLGAFERQF